MGFLDLFRRPAEPARELSGRHALVAGAALVTPEQGQKIAKGRSKRPWQAAAFRYRVAVPEVGYVMRFLGNNSTHIRLFVGDRPPGADEVTELDDDYGLIHSEDGSTVTRDPDALPEELVAEAQALLDLLTAASPSGGGASILAPLVQAFEGPGECWLIGRWDPVTDLETWAIHSISEVEFKDGRMPGMDPEAPRGYYRLTTSPSSKDGEDLDPAVTTVVRLWTSDPEWSAEPDSPMRTLAGVCERLMLVDRANDAALRNRAAGNGIFIVPDEISFAEDDEDDLDGDEQFQRDFTTQLITPLAQDGSAASVVPMLLRGPYAYVDRIRHLAIDRPMDPKLAEVETRLLARLGIGLDVPPEVITGYADVNHWNVWQVTSDTFKHHQEPITIRGMDALTLGYMRKRLLTPSPGQLTARWPQELVDRVVIWHDPASLVAPPDMREPANDAFDRGTISDKAHRRLLGLDESDAPEVAQAVDAPVGTTGMTSSQLNEVANIAGTLLRAGYEPDAVTTALGLAITHTGLVPVTVKPAEEPTAAPEQPTAPAEEPPATETPPAAEAPAEGTTAAGSPRPGVPNAEQRRLSRRLMDIDRRLRERVLGAADSALSRALERAGNRLRSKANGNDAARTAAAGQPGHLVASAMGRALVAALGADEQALLAEAFDRLRGQWTEWTTAAAEEAIDTAARIAGLPRADPNVMRAVGNLRDQFAAHADEAWPLLHQGLNDLAADLLYDPDPTVPAVGELPDTAVPPDLVRRALAVAGGLAADAALTPPLSGLSSGQLLDSFLRSAGTEPVEYEWAYGISSRVFHPHAALDGLVFADFADPALSTAGTGAEWIGASFAPGDHKGCHCDYAVIYADGNTRDELELLGRTAYGEQKPGKTVPGWEATTKLGERRTMTRPQTRRTPAAEAAAVDRACPPPPPQPPPVPPRAPPPPDGHRLNLDGDHDDSGYPWALDFDYLSALGPRELDELLDHAAETMADLDPRAEQRWTDLEEFLTHREARTAAEDAIINEAAGDWSEVQRRLTAWDDLNGRPGLTHPRVGGHERVSAGHAQSGLTHAEVAEEYAVWVAEQYVAAEDATRGAVLNAKGYARGVDPQSLFTGDVRRLYRYASEELLEWFETNRRITFSEWYYDRTGNAAYAASAARHALENAGITRDRLTNKQLRGRS